MSRPLRFTLITLLMLASVIASMLPVSPNQVSSAAGAIPAPIANGPRPTIALSPDHGYAGQVVVVSGQGVAPFPGVRVVWLRDDATRTATVVARDSSDNYKADLTVPNDLKPGPTQICAAVTGSAQAAFACATFVVDVPPSGSVRGAIPLQATGKRATSAAINAQMNLYTNTGMVVSSAPIAADGSFVINNVPPGTYDSGVTGTVPAIVTTGSVTVRPSGISDIIGVIDTTCRTTRVTQVRATLARDTLAAAEYDFGAYVALGASGSVVNETFEADLQVDDGSVIESVRFDLVFPNSQRVTIATDTSAPYQASYNASLLPVGITRLQVIPIVAGETQSLCRVSRTLNTISDPMRDPLIQPGGQTTWNAANRRYTFAGTIPNVGGLLPLSYPEPPPELPLLGRLENRLDMGIRVEGSLAFNGDMRLRVLRAEASARLFSQNIFNSSRDLLPAGAERLVVNPSDLRRIGIDLGPYTLYSFDTGDIPVFRSPIASFWGIVTVNASISVGISGDLVFAATVQPLLPAIDATLTASVRPRLSISIWVDILLGVASAGADATAEVSLGLPLRLNTEANPPVWIDNPCIRVNVNLSVWAAVNLWLWKERWTLGDWPLVNYAEGCPVMRPTATLAATITPPRVMAAPAITNGPGGRMLSVYVDDTTPAAENPTPQVVARFWNSTTQSWETSIALTDGTRMVQDPVAAFVGTDGAALVVWTQNSMTLEEARANGNNLPGLLVRQEIYAAYWNGTNWDAPQRLTNDTLPDGRAALEGDASGATLAWVRDTDGTMTTRTDWRIAMREWDAVKQTWSAMTLLGQPGTMNAQISVSRQVSPLLAWTTDKDGDLKTNDDRQIAVADYNQQSGLWDVSLPPELPVGADSPDIAFDPQLGPRLAFLVRGKDGDATTDTGIGNQALLWSATRTVDGWQPTPVLENNQPVRAERPQLGTGWQGESLLLFRRFGANGTNAELGQLALAQLAPGSTNFSAPLYLTDEARQHWQPALAVNQNTGQAMLLNVSRNAVSPPATTALQQALAPASTGNVALQTTTLAASSDSLEALVIEPGADPALDTSLMVSQQHAAPGTQVMVSATVRNRGRMTASTLAVRFFSGTPGSGTLLGTVDVPGSLGFNEAQVVVFPITVVGGEQPIYAEVIPSGGNTVAANDRATARLGLLPSPTFLSAAVSTSDPNALELSWLPSDVAGVAGYRILRSQTPGGPYELVGEATGTGYTDLLLALGQTYYYVVQAYDASGVLSEYSTEAFGSVPLKTLYLPLLRR